MENTETKQALIGDVSRVTLVANASGKGGIGKSTATCLLGCALEKEGVRIKMYDAESVNSKTKKMFDDAAEHYNIQDAKEQSRFLESLQDDADVIIHDTGASYSLADDMANTLGGGPGALSRLFGIIDEMGIDVTLLHMLTHNPETTTNIGDWFKALDAAKVTNVRHVVCINNAFVESEEDCPVWIGFQDMKTNKFVGGNTRERILQLQKAHRASVISLPRLHPVAAAKMEIFPMRYSMAMQNKSLAFAERLQVQSFFENAHESFRQAGRLLGFPDIQMEKAA